MEFEPGKMPEDKTERAAGVQGEPRVENNHYIVDVRWKDGVETTLHFPVLGFPFMDLQTNQRLKFFTGKEAVVILKKHAGDYAHGEFSWKFFIR